jgi:hypothetical protein
LLDVRFKCPACNGKLVVDAQAAGTEVTCPRCNEEVLVPEPGTEFPAPLAVPRATEPAADQDTFPAPPAPPQGDGGKLSKEEMDFLTSGPIPAAPGRPSPK